MGMGMVLLYPAHTLTIAILIGMIFPILSTDKNDESRFRAWFSLCRRSASPLVGSRRRPPPVYDVLLHSSNSILFAALADSCLLLISLLSHSNCFFC
jgi:hypothetical protein